MKKILTIDDRHDNQTTIQAIIKDYLPDCKILTAFSGKEGIKLAKKEQPDTILLDVVMPLMDGFEVCRALKADNTTKHIPVVMLTAMKVDTASRIKGLEAGADAFLIKPIDTAELMAQVKVMLRIKEAEDKLRKEKEVLDQKVQERIKELSNREKSFYSLFNSVSEAIYVQDRQGRFLEVNEGALKMYGYPKEYFFGKTPEIVSAPGKNDMEMIGKALQKALKGEPQQFEFWGIRKNGEIFPKEVRLSKGIYLGQEVIFALALDITQRKKAEKALRKANRTYAVLSNINQTIVRVKDKKTLFDKSCQIAVDDGKFKMAWFGLVDKKQNKVIPIASAGFTSNYIDSLNIDLNDKKFGNGPTGRVAKTGAHFIVNNISTDSATVPWKERALKLGYQSSASFPVNVFGKTIGVFNLYAQDPFFFDKAEVKLLDELAGDISFAIEFIENENKRKNAEEKLKESERKFNAIFNSNPNPAHLVNADFEIVLTNTKLLETINLKQEDIASKKCYEVYQNKKEVCENCAVRKVFKEKTSFKYENQLTLPNGDINYFETYAYPIFDEQNNVLYAVESTIDITDRKILEQKLEKQNKELTIAKEHAEESDRLKSAFLANMSHEIRTPMNGILGFAGLLKEPGLSGDEQQRYVRIIEKSGARMLNVINQIVDISKIEAGLMEVVLKEINVNEQIEDIYNFFKPEVEAKGIRFFFKTALPSKESIIKTDREKVYGVLINLVKNAIKYTKKGSIEFGYEMAGTEHSPFLQFYVKDTGIGIPKERQQAIFDRFVQADIEDKMAMQGAGLGLAISKAYVEMLGGKIWVESTEENMQEGKAGGSAFYFTIPYHSVWKTKNNHKEVSSWNEPGQLIKKLKILIVEDDKTSEQFITIALRQYSKEVITARTGKEAVEMCRNHPDIDLVLMDINLPVISGYEATRQIRKFNKKVIIIAQTAYGLVGDREKSIEAGCDDYVSKPIDKNELIGKISRLVAIKSR